MGQIGFLYSPNMGGIKSKMGQIAFRRTGCWDCIKMYKLQDGPNRVFIQSQHGWYKIQDAPNKFLERLTKFRLTRNQCVKLLAKFSFLNNWEAWNSKSVKSFKFCQWLEWLVHVLPLSLATQWVQIGQDWDWKNFNTGGIKSKLGQIAFRRVGCCDCIKMYVGPIGPDRVLKKI